MTLNQRIRSFCTSVEKYTNLPDELQTNGYYKEYPDCPDFMQPHECCFGARIARALCEPKYDTDEDGDECAIWYFVDGESAIYDQLQIDPRTLKNILFACGTGLNNPFGRYRWAHPISYVMERLVKIERLPTDLENEILSELSYSHGFVFYNYDREWNEEQNPVIRIYESLCEPTVSTLK